MDNISFTIGSKEVFGIVGPDGAGKTTLIRMLCGLLKPDSGTADILGFDLLKQTGKIKDEIGYLSQKFSLYADLTIDENIEFFAELHGVKNFSDRRNELLDFTRLESFRGRLAGKLSGGMKQKLALACTLIHKPKIIFLDEPTTGVDPVSRRDFWKILSDLHNDGVTIVISTPYMDEAERFNKIAMINNGKLLMNDSPAEIKSSMNKIIAEILTENLRDTYNLIVQKNGYEAQLFGDRIDIALNNENELRSIESLLNENNIQLLSKKIKPVSLENVFIHVLKED
ncbi:MAG TPA: ABC transporter ATP-binding protein [Ignavibacteria bacterium]|nr:ABC transporter ATP-binding protein [Ignavibacteria bacterium]HRF67327.1 ABC transporter ATP-binding protein [Ignavibacteria bacterium]HRJ03025.1 ABC transporter ATP-binding protein [Ignavibacteria bacterium]HRJ85764.1 ABC transporter ATP-binding protein [Ignavibacteria bacterium]